MTYTKTFNQTERYEWEPKHYEYRLIVFIDVLGWKKYLKTKKLYEILRIVKKISEKVSKETFFESMIKYNNHQKKIDGIDKEKEFTEAVKCQDKQISVFSDSIVISYSDDKKYLQWSLQELAVTLKDLQDELINNQTLIRGCISFGNLYHKGNICIGDALVRSAGIETIYAKYPRIVVDKLFANHKPFRVWIEENSIFEKYADEYFGISHCNRFQRLSEYTMKLDETEIGKMTISYEMKKYYDVISKNITSNNSSTFLKYKWLATQYKNTYAILKEQGEFCKVAGNLELNYKTPFSMYFKIFFNKIWDYFKVQYVKREYGI